MPCAERISGRASKQRGAAVVVALFVLALVAIVAASSLDAFGAALDAASGRQERDQARLLARGAVDWARNVLADDKLNSTADHAGEAWAVKVPPTPVEEGEVSGEIADLSGRFNLNNLAPGGLPDARASGEFIRLLGQLGIDAGRATTLATRLQARLGQTASGGGPLLHPEQLRQLAGFDAALYARLQPLVAALPAPSAINVNTAPPEVLVALLPGLSPGEALTLTESRRRAWFRDLADFAARLPQPEAAPGAPHIDIASRHFLVSGRARYGQAVVALEVLLERNQAWPTIVWQRLP
jgi:general secretion pathway protein K